MPRNLLAADGHHGLDMEQRGVQQSRRDLPGRVPGIYIPRPGRRLPSRTPFTLSTAQVRRVQYVGTTVANAIGNVTPTR